MKHLPRTTLDWFKTMPKEYALRAIANARENALSTFHPDLPRAISTAFIWKKSREKHDFWFQVKMHYADPNVQRQLPPIPDLKHNGITKNVKIEKANLLVILVALLCSCNARTPKPSIYIDGEPYVLISECVKYETQVQYDWHFGYNEITGRNEWHFGRIYAPVCVEVKVDTIAYSEIVNK